MLVSCSSGAAVELRSCRRLPSSSRAHTRICWLAATSAGLTRVSTLPSCRAVSDKKTNSHRLHLRHYNTIPTTVCRSMWTKYLPCGNLPTILFCLLMVWQISLAAAIWAFSPSKVPRVARSMKETQRRLETASAGHWVVRVCDAHSMRRVRKEEKCVSSHVPPKMDTNTTQVYMTEMKSIDIKPVQHINFIQFRGNLYQLYLVLCNN